ncbi:MAG TPA: cytochrome c maturation protein CcmE [Gammaproteobacteria bacterium]|jgi:cytochrome c-type biogenesis protein CcmE|nr:cytochrome c maturation protein CcmE [Gammaproteobacteria bacterium]
MTPRRKRMMFVLAIVVGVGAATALGLQAFRGNLLYYFTPTQIAAGKAPIGQRFRMGGLVVPGSIHRQPGSMTVRFTLTDNTDSVPVMYTGILPDLFREGQGIVVHGKLLDDHHFVADQVLAKHSADYMPPAVAESLKKHHRDGEAAAKAATGA